MVKQLMSIVALCWTTGAAVLLAAQPFDYSIIVQEPDGRCAMYPDILRLRNGDVLVSYYSQTWETDMRRYGKFAQEHLDPPRDNSPTGGQICYVRSTDSGQTWSESKLIADTPWDDRPHNQLSQLSDGTLLCAWFVIWDWPARGYGPPPPGEDAQMGLFVSRSTDSGHTWSEPYRVLKRPDFHVASGSHIRELRDGSLLWALYYYDQTHTQQLYGLTVRSRDKGMTWDEVAVIGGSTDLRLEEGDLLELNDGRVLASVSKSRDKGVIATSDDSGRTWPASNLRSLAFGTGGPALLRLRDARILMSFSNNLSVSADEGLSWSDPITVGDIGHYARTAELDDDGGTLLHVNHEYGAWSAIRLYRLNLDADNRKRMLPAVGLHISTSRLTEGYHNENYFARLDAWCGVPPFTWEIETGSLPPGMRLQSSKGMIFGRAEQSGEFPLKLRVTDATGATATRTITLVCRAERTNVN